MHRTGPDYCNLMMKANNTQTFSDATEINMDSSLKHVRISPNTWPMVTHVHGAEVRPTFDGNPLSWIDNSGNNTKKCGIAAFSLKDNCYFDSFDNYDEHNRNYNPPRI